MKSFVPDVGLITEIKPEESLSSGWFKKIIKKLPFDYYQMVISSQKILIEALKIKNQV